MIVEGECSVCVLIATGHGETQMFIRGFVAGMQRVTHQARVQLCELHEQAIGEALAAEVGNGVSALPPRSSTR